MTTSVAIQRRPLKEQPSVAEYCSPQATSPLSQFVSGLAVIIGPWDDMHAAEWRGHSVGVKCHTQHDILDNKVHVANMGPAWS